MAIRRRALMEIHQVYFVHTQESYNCINNAAETKHATEANSLYQYIWINASTISQQRANLRLLACLNEASTPQLELKERKQRSYHS